MARDCNTDPLHALFGHPLEERNTVIVVGDTTLRRGDGEEATMPAPEGMVMDTTHHTVFRSDEPSLPVEIQKMFAEGIKQAQLHFLNEQISELRLRGYVVVDPRCQSN